MSTSRHVYQPSKIRTLGDIKDLALYFFGCSPRREDEFKSPRFPTSLQVSCRVVWLEDAYNSREEMQAALLPPLLYEVWARVCSEVPTDPAPVSRSDARPTYRGLYCRVTVPLQHIPTAYTTGSGVKGEIVLLSSFASTAPIGGQIPKLHEPGRFDVIAIVKAIDIERREVVLNALAAHKDALVQVLAGHRVTMFKFMR